MSESEPEPLPIDDELYRHAYRQLKRHGQVLVDFARRRAATKWDLSMNAFAKSSTFGSSADSPKQKSRTCTKGDRAPP